jgi:hypothetical protein
MCAPLGAGAQGSTWEGVDKREGRPVAIKRFDVRGARSWKDVELAEREARVLASLSHPKLPAYVDHFEEDGALYLVMEKIEGTPLSTLCKRGPMSEADARRLLEDADDVLRYLHGRQPPVIHRDLKPGNVLRRPDGSFAFVDFGAVRDRMRPEGGSTVVGTFGYMAPEQLQGRAGPATDVYALGATVISALTGREPEQLPHRGLSIDVDAALGPSVSRALRATLASMLEPDPDRRPTSIAESIRGGQSPRSVDPMASDMHQRFERELRERIEQAFDVAGLSTRAKRRAERRMRRLQKKAERRLLRIQERSSWRAHSHALDPNWHQHRGHQPPAHMIAALVLTFAQFAVGIALGLFVPLVLAFLSMFFGPALRRASRRVRVAGGRAVGAIGEARRFMLEVHSEEHAAVRVDVGAQGGLRNTPLVEEEQGRLRVSDRDSDDLDAEVTSSSDFEERSSRPGAIRR